jgi:sulfotransferase family protein
MDVNIPFPFIVGRGRSGTTLLRSMLDSHPLLAIPNESHFVVPFLKDRRLAQQPLDINAFWSAITERGRRFGQWGVPPDSLKAALSEDAPTTVEDALRSTFRAYALWRGKPRYGDKTPIHVLHIKLLSDRFPEARFIHMIRDGRDAALSYLDVDFGPNTLAEAAVYWRRFVRAGRAAGNRLSPSRYLEVRYEDLAANPREVLDRVSDFLDLRFDEAMLTYHERRDLVPVGAIHHQNLRIPPTKALRDWRVEMSARDVRTFEGVAGDLLDELGYPRARGRSVAIALAGVRARIFVERRRLARRVSGSGWHPAKAGHSSNPQSK